MKTPQMPLSAWFVAIGTVAVLLIGAFGNFSPANSQPKPAPDQAVANPAQSPLPPNLSPGMDEIIRMAQAHVDQSLILAYILNSNQHYIPTADEILYLSNLGLPQNVISALFKAAPSPPTQPRQVSIPAIPVVETPQLADTSGLYANPAPYGNWVQGLADTSNDRTLLAGNDIALDSLPDLADSSDSSVQLPPLCSPTPAPPLFVLYLPSSRRAFSAQTRIVHHLAFPGPSPVATSRASGNAR
jgi:hypothetical protein